MGYCNKTDNSKGYLEKTKSGTHTHVRARTHTHTNSDAFLLVSKLRLIEVFNTPNTKSISTIFRVNIPVMDMLSVSLKPSLPPISQNTFGDGIQKVVDMGQMK